MNFLYLVKVIQNQTVLHLEDKIISYKILVSPETALKLLILINNRL